MNIKVLQYKNANLSEILEKVIEDVQKVSSLGVEIDMDRYFRSNGHCSACLGGAAILGYCENDEDINSIIRNAFSHPGTDDLDEVINQISKEDEQYLYNLARLCDDLRTKSYYEIIVSYSLFHRYAPDQNFKVIISNWCAYFPIKFVSNCFKLNDLIYQLKYLVNSLKEGGY